MMKRRVRPLLVPLVVLGLALAWGYGCSGGGGFSPDTSLDTDDEDVSGDTTTDGEDTADAPGDTGTDGGDVIEDDGGGTGGGTPFTTESAGGARLTSPNYTLEVFIAPVRPVGNPSSTNYDIKLGPGGIRSH